MSVKLHKVTVFVIDHSIPGDDEGDGLAQLQGDMYHNSGSRIVEIQTAEFDREWSDDDPLNKTTTMDNRALLESLVEGKPKRNCLDNGETTMFVLIKTRVPDWYEDADCAVIEVTEDLVLMLDKRMAKTKSMFERDFYGTRWWDNSPYFIGSGGPEGLGLDMTEEEFEHRLEANYFIPLPNFKEPEEHAPASIDTVILTMSAVLTANETTMGGFQWSGYDKYVGDSCRVTTYEMADSTIDLWAELIGCTEMLAQVRRCRGVE